MRHGFLDFGESRLEDWAALDCLRRALSLLLGQAVISGQLSVAAQVHLAALLRK